MTDHLPVTAPSDDDRLERYLLGLLDEPARDEVEAQAFADPTVAKALDEVETTLVDAYAAGTLSGERLEAFRRAVADRPRLQARLRVARALSQREPRARVARWWLPALGAAAALVIASSIWLLGRIAPPASLPAPVPAQTTSVDDAPPADALTPEPVEPPAAGTPPVAPRAPTRSVFAVTLPIGVSRAADVAEIRVPAASTHLHLRVPIAPGDDFARYRVRLRGPDGRELGVADPALLAPDRTVSLTVAREALAAGLHEVAVEGLDARDTAEPLSLQQVRVTIDAARR